MWKKWYCHPYTVYETFVVQAWPFAYLGKLQPIVLKIIPPAWEERSYLHQGECQRRSVQNLTDAG